MAKILLLTPASAEILPALALLTHDVTVAPLAAGSVADRPGIDLIFLDGISDLASSKTMAELLSSARVPVPVILLLAETSLAAVDGSWGIDDVVLSGTPLGELDARIRLALTRPHRTSHSTALHHAGITIDEASFQASVGGRTLDLTFKEFELLRYLVGNPGRVFTREQLLSEVWGYDYFGGTRTVDVHIRRLRAKLGDHESVIGTVRNVGYRFSAEGDAA